MGLTGDTKPSDLLRSCLESVILRLNGILELINKTVQGKYEKAKYIVASGNALERNTLWRQMLSDCTGMGVMKDGDAHEGTSRGVEILISRIRGGNSGSTMNQEALVVDEEQVPNARSKSLWSKRKDTQECAIQCLSPMWK